MIISPYLFKREMLNDAVVSLSNVIKSKFNISDSFIYRDGSTVPSLEDHTRKSNILEVKYTVEDDTEEARRISSNIRKKNIIWDNQFKLDIALSVVKCKINYTVKTKSEIKAHITRDFIATKLFSKRRFLYSQLVLYRIDGSINKILTHITKQASICLGIPVDIKTYLKYQSKELTLVGTEAGAESYVDYSLKVSFDNEAIIKSLSKTEFDNDTGFYTYSFELETRLFIVDKNILDYDDVIFNAFIPDFMIENKVNNVPVIQGEDTFYKIVDYDTKNILPTVSGYDLIFSILLLCEYDSDGNYIPFMLNLRELGDYTIPDSFLIKLKNAVNNKEPWCELTVNLQDNTFKKYNMVIDNDYNVIFHDVPDCGESLRLCLYVSISTFNNPPVGEVICHGDECICIEKQSNASDIIPKIIEYSKIVTHIKGVNNGNS